MKSQLEKIRNDLESIDRIIKSLQKQYQKFIRAVEGTDALTPVNNYDMDVIETLITNTLNALTNMETFNDLNTKIKAKALSIINDLPPFPIIKDGLTAGQLLYELIEHMN